MNQSLTKDLLNSKKIIYPLLENYSAYAQGCSSFYPWSLEIHPTAMCNHRCIHCSYKERNENRASLPQSVMEQLIQSIIQMKIKGVYFSGGGEPSVYPQISKHMEKLISAGTEVSIITNGSNLEKSGIVDLADRLNYIAISVPSCKEDIFEQITGVNRLQEVLQVPNLVKRKHPNKHAIVGARVVVTSLISNEIELIYDTLKSQGFDYIIYKIVRDYEDRGLGLNDSDSEKLKRTISDMKAKGKTNEAFTNLESVFSYRNQPNFEGICHVNQMGLLAAVTPEGEVYPNIVEIGDSDFCIGNLNQNSLENLWNSSEHLKIKENSNLKWSHKKCKNCRAIIYNEMIQAFMHQSFPVLDPFI